MHGFQRCVAYHAKADVGGTHYTLSVLVSSSSRCYNGQTQATALYCLVTCAVVHWQALRPQTHAIWFCRQPIDIDSVTLVPQMKLKLAVLATS